VGVGTLVRRASLAIVVLASCREPGQSPPPIETGRPPPAMMRPHQPRSSEDGDEWVQGDGGAPASPTTPAIRCPSGSAPFSDGTCVVEEIHCPRGTTRVGTICYGEVECPAGSVWDGRSCQPESAPPASSAAAGTCTLMINSIPATMVVVDGKPVGMTPRMALPAVPGSHTVSFVHDEYGKKTVTVTCKADEKKTVVVKMKD
jgi:hypothetical protein